MGGFVFKGGLSELFDYCCIFSLDKSISFLKRPLVEL